MDTSKIIERLGGTAKTAALFNVTPGAISQWLQNGIPKARLMYLQVARPEVLVDDPETPPLTENPAAHPPAP